MVVELVEISVLPLRVTFELVIVWDVDFEAHTTYQMHDHGADKDPDKKFQTPKLDVRDVGRPRSGMYLYSGYVSSPVSIDFSHPYCVWKFGDGGILWIEAPVAVFFKLLFLMT